jgi:hypothetical protein
MPIAAAEINTPSFLRQDSDAKHVSMEDMFDALSYPIEKEQSCRPNGTPIVGQFHLVRKDIDHVVGAHGVGSQFSVIQPHDVARAVRDSVLSASPNAKIDSLGFFDYGSTFWVNVRFDDYAVPGDDSPIRNRVLFADPMTLGTIKIAANNVRVVCQNTLAMAMKQTSADGFIRHTVTAEERVLTVLGMVKASVLDHLRLRAFSKSLAGKQVDSLTLKKVLDRAIPAPVAKEGRAYTIADNLRNAVTKAFETDQTMRNGTAWKLLNAYTYQIDHGTMGKIKSESEFSFDLLVGGRGEKKTRFMNILAEEVGVAKPAAFEAVAA